MIGAPEFARTGAQTPLGLDDGVKGAGGKWEE